MIDPIERADALQALVECEDIKGYAYRQMEEAIKAIPSADRPQSTCEYGEYCMCATCHYQEDCSYCADCTEAKKQMHDVWTCTKYMRKENLRKGADDDID